MTTECTEMKFKKQRRTFIYIFPITLSNMSEALGLATFFAAELRVGGRETV